MSLDFDELAKAMASTEQVKDATADKAEEVREQLRMRWPDVEKVSPAQRAFLSHDKGNVVTVTESTRSNRPTHVVTVRHPGAVAKQAKDGFVTKVMKSVQ